MTYSVINGVVCRPTQKERAIICNKLNKEYNKKAQTVSRRSKASRIDVRA